MTGSNGNRPTPEQPWGIPQEVDAPVTRDTFIALVADILLRLEKTPDGKALAYPMLTVPFARRARSAVAASLGSRLGKNAIKTVLQDEPPTLYVMRGPNYRSMK